MTEIEKSIIELIKAMRGARGLTQKDLAEKLNTKQSAIARLENGGRGMTILMLSRIAEACGFEFSVGFKSKYTIKNGLILGPMKASN